MHRKISDQAKTINHCPVVHDLPAALILSGIFSDRAAGVSIPDWIYCLDKEAASMRKGYQWIGLSLCLILLIGVYWYINRPESSPEPEATAGAI